MKMRKILLAMLTAMLTLSLAAFAACAGGEENKEDLTGFDVPETASAELGSVYEIPILLVYDSDRVIYDVSVKVENGGKEVEISNNAFVIENLSEYKVIYTVEKKNEEKTTTITVSDTSAPGIIFEGIPSRVKGNTEVDLSGITVTDWSAVGFVEKKVTLGDREIEVKDDKFTPDGYGIYSITVTARDEFGNENSLSYKMECLAENQLYTFDAMNESADFSTGFASIKQVEGGVTDDGGCLMIIPTQGWHYVFFRQIGYGRDYTFNLNLPEYQKYATLEFMLYIDTDNEKPQNGNCTPYNNGVTTAVPCNTWVRISYDIEKVDASRYTILWADSPKPTAVYIDDIRLAEFDPVIYDYDTKGGLNDGKPTRGENRITDNPFVDEEHPLSKVLSVETDPTLVVDFLNLNAALGVNYQKFGYTKLAIDIYVDVSYENNPNPAISFDGFDNGTEWDNPSPLVGGRWITVEHVLDEGFYYRLMFWWNAAGVTASGNVYIDNVRFTK